MKADSTRIDNRLENYEKRLWALEQALEKLQKRDTFFTREAEENE